ncbi:hypothetical protein [Carnobacterium antarcticum]|uniref:Cell division protein FtsL n=1 Tax=Carnobacterium antarcticum TaxID=2126436 RepID=A0ABW4NNG0_9LACT|nr:hypothetical protein [Carnobacterium sp. CP1]ALV20733.1 hypothetical protein NY10_108 [Carnobacterium sp. CP1]
MTKELKQLLLWFALIVVMVAALGYGIYSGAKVNSLEETVIENEKEMKVLNADLKSHKALMLERDIEILGKDSTIQSLVAQNEALMWRLPEGSQDE